MKRKLSLLSVLLLIMVPVLTACGSGTDNDGLFVTIATGGQSGVYYPLGGALGKIYEKELKSKSTVQATGASVENINLLDKNRAELAIIMGDAATQAHEGTEPFDKKITSFKAVASLYPNFVQIVTTDKAKIDKVEDLKGKRVGVGAPGSGVELNAQAILKAHDMSYDDFKEDFLSYSEAIDGIKNGTVDAAFVTSGLPNPSVTDLETTEKVKVIPIEGKGMKKLKELYPYYSENIIPKGTYGNDHDIKTASIMNLLVVNDKLDDETVYKLTKTMFENIDSVQKSHNAAKDITLETAKDNVPIPFHPGAEKYYKEANTP